MNIVFFIGSILQIISVALLIIGIRKILRKQFKKSAIILVFFLITIFYWIIIRERIILVRYIYRSFSKVENTFTTYIWKYHRYPLNFEELQRDTLGIRLLSTYESYPLVEKPLFLKEPKYGIKTELTDTLIFTVLYSYGLDYDDDSLKRKYYFGPLLKRTNYIQYILSPIPIDGDLYIRGLGQSIWDPFFDTVFVRQLFELHGDTLSPEEYNVWMEKRKEYWEKGRN